MSSTFADESIRKTSVELSCDALRTGDELQISLVMTNRGREPVILDRELVLLVDMTFLDASGRAIVPIRVDGDTEREPKKSDLSRRFVELRPGDSLTRTIRAFVGFRAFEYGIAEGETTLSATGYECTFRVPTGSEVSKVKVTYGIRHGLREGFRAFTGSSLEALRVYQESLVGTCEVRKE